MRSKGWFGSRNYSGDRSSVTPKEQEAKRVVEDVFDSYTDNKIKSFVVNHHIENVDDRNMDINDLKIVNLLHVDNLKDHCFNIEKLVIDEKTKDIFIQNMNSIDIKSVHHLSFSIMYDDVYIDTKNSNYMSVTTSSSRNIESNNTPDHEASNIYFIIIKIKGTVYGLVCRLEKQTLIIHPTMYVPLSSFYSIPFGCIGFVAIDSIENEELLCIISNSYGVLAEEFDEMSIYDLDRVHSHKRLKTWYSYIPRVIIYKVKQHSSFN